MGVLRFSVEERMRLVKRLGSPDELSKLGKKRSESRFPEKRKPGRNPRYIGSHPAFKVISNCLLRCELATHHAAQAEQTRTQQGQRARLRNCGE